MLLVDDLFGVGTTALSASTKRSVGRIATGRRVRCGSMFLSFRNWRERYWKNVKRKQENFERDAELQEAYYREALKGLVA